MKTTLTLASVLLLAGLAQAKVTETFQKTVPITVNGALNLENVNGSVTITTWDKLEIGIEAEKSANDEEALKRIRIEVKAEGDHVHIKTLQEKKFLGGKEGAVTYKLQVPANISLDSIEAVNASLTITGVAGPAKLETVNGSIHVEGLSHDAKITTVNGSIYASFAKLPAGSHVKLESTNGSNTVVLPHDVRTRLEAETVNGKVHVEVPSAENSSQESSETQQSVSTSTDGHTVSLHREAHEVKAVIGAPDSTVEVETVNGSVTVKTF